MKTHTTRNKIMQIVRSPLTWRALGIFLLLASTSTAYCDAEAEIEAQVTTLMGTIFSKSIRLIVLLFGMTWGFLKTVMSGSFQPIIMYGGISCCFFFVPKLIMLLASIGV
ncbi:MAG: hypothetical protein K1060chlam2_00572 [Chlamydiae bacterium]|nr:hypothetical protein [Chlamydiota bacterium]